MDRIDKKFEKLGFKKTKEDKYGVGYERVVPKYEFIHCIDILHKASGRHLIMSYEKKVNNDGFSNMVGTSIQETKLILKKFKIMKRKYHWE